MKIKQFLRPLMVCLWLGAPLAWGAPDDKPSRNEATRDEATRDEATRNGPTRKEAEAGQDRPTPRPVTACAIPISGEKGATQPIQEAVDAVYAAAAPGAGKAELNELAFKLITLARSGENNAPICDRAPIDKLALDGSRFRKSRGETVLTAAADTGNLAVLELTLNAVRLANGDIYATDYCGNSAYQLLQAQAPKEMRAQLNPNKYNLGRLNDCGDHTVPLAAKADANPPSDGPSLPFTIQALSNSSPAAPDTYSAGEPIRIPAYVTALLNANQGVSLSAQSSHGVNTPSFRGELRITPNDFSRSWLPGGRPFAFVNGNVGPKGGGNPQFVSSGVGWTSSIDLMPLFAPIASDAAQERGNEAVTWLTSTYRAGVIQNRIYNQNLYYKFASASYTWYAPFPHRIKGGYYLYGSITGGAQVQDQYGTGAPTAAELTSGQIYSVPRSYTFARLDAHGYPCGLISPFYTCPAAISKMTFYADTQWTSGYSGNLVEFGATFPLPVQKGISVVISRVIGHKDPLASFGVPQSNKVVETNVALTVSFP